MPVLKARLRFFDCAMRDIESERTEGGFDAVFLAVGAQLARRVEIPAGDSSRILDALSFLHQVARVDVGDGLQLADETLARVPIFFRVARARFSLCTDRATSSAGMSATTTPPT